MTIDDINDMTDACFLKSFSELYEHSPWVVEQAASRRPFRDLASMLSEMDAVVREAGQKAQLDLLLSHSELAGKAAIDNDLTKASAEEQASAGLNRMTPAEHELFHCRNNAYRKQFGFPFIICVRETTKAGIIEAMADRLGNDERLEFQTALDEISKIVALRLSDLVA